MAPESIDDFIARMESRYSVAPEFHKSLSESIRKFCIGRQPEEVSYFLGEIEGAYDCRSRMETCIANMKGFIEVIGAEQDPHAKALAIEAYKKERDAFDELQRYAKAKIDDYLARVLRK